MGFYNFLWFSMNFIGFYGFYRLLWVPTGFYRGLICIPAVEFEQAGPVAFDEAKDALDENLFYGFLRNLNYFSRIDKKFYFWRLSIDQIRL